MTRLVKTAKTQDGTFVFIPMSDHEYLLVLNGHTVGVTYDPTPQTLAGDVPKAIMRMCAQGNGLDVFVTYMYQSTEYGFIVVLSPELDNADLSIVQDGVVVHARMHVPIDIVVGGMRSDAYKKAFIEEYLNAEFARHMFASSDNQIH